MSAKNGSIKLVAGNSNPTLAKEIASWLDLSLTKAIGELAQREGRAPTVSELATHLQMSESGASSETVE